MTSRCLIYQTEVTNRITHNSLILNKYNRCRREHRPKTLFGLYLRLSPEKWRSLGLQYEERQVCTIRIANGKNNTVHFDFINDNDIEQSGSRGICFCSKRRKDDARVVYLNSRLGKKYSVEMCAAYDCACGFCFIISYLNPPAEQVERVSIDEPRESERREEGLFNVSHPVIFFVVVIIRLSQQVNYTSRSKNHHALR